MLRFSFSGEATSALPVGGDARHNLRLSIECDAPLKLLDGADPKDVADVVPVPYKFTIGLGDEMVS